MKIVRGLTIALAIVLSVSTIFARNENVAPQERAAVQPFKFSTGDFWLNLHSFLYVLGRNEMKAPDRGRRAVVNAPIEAAHLIAVASEQDRAVWNAAVTFYAAGPSKRDAVFDMDFAAVTKALADAPPAAAEPQISAQIFNAEWRAILRDTAPVYRRVFWPAHEKANEARLASQNALIAQHGAAILGTVTRAFGQQWIAGGFPVHFSAYANWAGAYSTDLGTLVVSSLDDGNADVSGLETLFHEAMHQWDRQMDDVLTKLSTAADVKVPDNLSHSLIFYTAGEATRKAVPEHVPYAVANGLWPRLGQPVKDALDKAWKPWLDGQGTRNAALTEVLRLLAPKTP